MLCDKQKEIIKSILDKTLLVLFEDVQKEIIDNKENKDADVINMLVSLCVSISGSLITGVKNEDVIKDMVIVTCHSLMKHFIPILSDDLMEKNTREYHDLPLLKHTKMKFND